MNSQRENGKLSCNGLCKESGKGQSLCLDDEKRSFCDANPIFANRDACFVSVSMNLVPKRERKLSRTNQSKPSKLATYARVKEKISFLASCAMSIMAKARLLGQFS